MKGLAKGIVQFGIALLVAIGLIFAFAPPVMADTVVSTVECEEDTGGTCTSGTSNKCCDPANNKKACKFRGGHCKCASANLCDAPSPTTTGLEQWVNGWLGDGWQNFLL